MSVFELMILVDHIKWYRFTLNGRSLRCCNVVTRKPCLIMLFSTVTWHWVLEKDFIKVFMRWFLFFNHSFQAIEFVWSKFDIQSIFTSMVILLLATPITFTLHTFMLLLVYIKTSPIDLQHTLWPTPKPLTWPTIKPSDLQPNPSPDLQPNPLTNT